jgi:hypothetical protein
VFLAVLVWTGYQRLETRRAIQQETGRILAAVTLDMEAGQYEAAFQTLAESRARFPEQAALRHAQEDAAMLWARNVRVRVGERTFADVVNTIRPVLSAGAAETAGARAADLLAHLGWCEYLLNRETASGNPETYFRRAAELDGSNPYARAMWGFWSFSRGAGVSDVAKHFEEAASSGRERPWVRNLQISAMLFRPSAEHEQEAIRVANTMRREDVAVEETRRLWSIFQSRLLYDQPALLQTLPPAELVLTFKWLFPEDSIAEDRRLLHRFMTARLDEAAGNRDAALAAYRQIEQQVKDSPGSLQDRTLEGIRRLTATP